MKLVNRLFFIFLTLCHNPVALSTGSKNPRLTENPAYLYKINEFQMGTERTKSSMEANREAAADFASKAALSAGNEG